LATSVVQKRAAFRRLHEAGCFVLPNPWDLGSAVLLQHLGFKALATTSAGMAWSMGRADGDVDLEQALNHFSQLAHASDVPLNADFENAFGDAPDEVAKNVALAVDTGVAGLSVEDWSGSTLYEFDVAVARVAAARAAIDRNGSGVLLTGRAEGFLHGAPHLDEVIRRLKAFSAAGADCLYAPGIRDESQIRAVVQAVAPKPVNLLATGVAVATLASWGVRRISVGGALAGVAYGAFYAAAQEVAEKGTFGGLAGASGGRIFNPIFSTEHQR
jgi:2-methylisocitrate lyase-like PEP mutase family enzyme